MRKKEEEEVRTRKDEQGRTRKNKEEQGKQRKKEEQWQTRAGKDEKGQTRKSKDEEGRIRKNKDEQGQKWTNKDEQQLALVPQQALPNYSKLHSIIFRNCNFPNMRVNLCWTNCKSAISGETSYWELKSDIHT